MSGCRREEKEGIAGLPLQAQSEHCLEEWLSKLT